MPVKVICAWCKRDLTPQILEYSPREVSHTMCDSCLVGKLVDDPLSIREFLDDQAFPILMVDDDGVVLSGNSRAERTLGKSLDDMQGVLGGDVVACVNAGDAGGCGHTAKCGACEFRGAFEQTYQTGRALVEQPVRLTVRSAAGAPSELGLTLSTRKVGSAVVITIHEVRAL